MVRLTMKKNNKSPKTIHFVSLGCPKNRVDTEALAGIAIARGFEVRSSPEDADVITVNTCGFVADARQESIDVLCAHMVYKEKHRCRVLIATGCLSQRYGDELALELPEYDYFLGTSNLEQFGKILDGEAGRLSVGEAGHTLTSAFAPRFLEPGARTAYVKIADGCSRRCAFCSIPAIRGRVGRSRPVDDIVTEAKNLVDRGVFELVLVAQDTSAYGRDLGGDASLCGLLRALDKVDGLGWIRVMYLYPDAVDDALLGTMADCERIVPYIDVPIQHASANVLRAMRRGHGPSVLRQMVTRIKKKLPQAFLRTAVLVGHPKETEKDFAQLLEFIEWARFDHLGAFRYSKEEGTASFDMDDTVSKRDSYNRARRLLALQRRLSRQTLKARRGSFIDVLVEAAADDQGYVLEGRHQGQAPEIDGKTFLVSSDAAVGQVVRARIIDTSDHDVVATAALDS
jgi:ribosomal protein S12 methylthiotransferase